MGFSDGVEIEEVFKAIATNGKGIEELMEGLERHRKYLKASNLMNIGQKQYDESELLELLSERLIRRILGRIGGKEHLRQYVERISHKDIDPYSAVDMLLEEIAL